MYPLLLQIFLQLKGKVSLFVVKVQTILGKVSTLYISYGLGCKFFISTFLEYTIKDGLFNLI